MFLAQITTKIFFLVKSVNISVLLGNLLKNNGVGFVPLPLLYELLYPLHSAFAVLYNRVFPMERFTKRTAQTAQEVYFFLSIITNYRPPPFIIPAHQITAYRAKRCFLAMYQLHIIVGYLYSVTPNYQHSRIKRKAEA